MDALANTAAGGIAQTAQLQQMLANDIANISTPGFKKALSSATLTAVKIDGPGFDTRFVSTTSNDSSLSLAPGPISYTGSQLDIAMQGSTVLGVTAPNGDLAFTRRGDLQVNSAGQLQTGAGDLVQGMSGLITVPAGAEVTLTGDGSVFASNPNGGPNVPPVLVGRLLLRDASTTPIMLRGDGLFTPMGAQPGTPADITNGPNAPSVSVGAIENSNVSISESIVKMIALSRSFEAGVKLIKEAKDLDASGASMMKLS